MKAYKGFDKDLKCRGFQYEIGREYQETEASLCRKGFHACENPLDTFRYYPPTGSRYCEVEIADNGQRNSDDSKVCGEKIKIGAEIGLDGVIKAGARFIFETCKGSAEDRASGERGNAAASGWRGNAAASGWSGNAAASGLMGTATVTGLYGGAKALGNDCLAAAWGPESKAMGKAGNWLVLSDHKCGAIVDARLVRVDGEIIKPDTWYTLRNGKIMEAN
jgi:hypothetical protein|nr:MAG TPA_asm: hypothetical protein [Caudoviricetes sp.]